MKRIWASILILILLVAVCIAGAQVSHTRTDPILSTIADIQETVREGDDARALSMSLMLIDMWEESHHVLCMYMSHSRLEAVDDTLAALPALIRGGETAQFSAECDRAAAQIRQLIVTEEISIENIL